jgi:hypothetical protein
MGRDGPPRDPELHISRLTGPRPSRSPKRIPLPTALSVTLVAHLHITIFLRNVYFLRHARQDRILADAFVNVRRPTDSRLNKQFLRQAQSGELA